MMCKESRLRNPRWLGRKITMLKQDEKRIFGLVNTASWLKLQDKYAEFTDGKLARFGKSIPGQGCVCISQPP